MITLPQDLRALSLLQPWASFVASGQKTIENRLKWKTSNFRGWFLVHASLRPKRAYYNESLEWMSLRGLARWFGDKDNGAPIVMPWEASEGPFGGIIGIANVYSAIYPGGVTKYGFRHPNGKNPWYMGGFALYVQDARPLPFIPCKGALGWFRPPADVVARVREEVARLA